MSKSKGKVYAGDIVDLEVDGKWIVAEIIGVDDFGLSVCGGGHVCHLDFRNSQQKQRVRAAGTYTGNAGLYAASSRATKTVATSSTPANQNINVLPTISQQRQQQQQQQQQQHLRQQQRLKIKSPVQQTLLKRYPSKLLVDVLNDDMPEEHWYCAQVVRSVPSTTQSNSIILTIRELGSSTYTNKSMTINHQNAATRLSKFATKSTIK